MILMSNIVGIWHQSPGGDDKRREQMAHHLPAVLFQNQVGGVCV